MRRIIDPRDHKANCDIVDTGFETPCWLYQGTVSGAGYMYTYWNEKRVPAHRAVYECQVRTLRPLEAVHHLCKVKRCLNPEHLMALTGAEHTRLHNFNQYVGERNPSAKLTDEQVAEIRQRYKQGDATQVELAKTYGISPGHVYRIIKRSRRATTFSK